MWPGVSYDSCKHGVSDVLVCRLVQHRWQLPQAALARSYPSFQVQRYWVQGSGMLQLVSRQTRDLLTGADHQGGDTRGCINSQAGTLILHSAQLLLRAQLKHAPPAGVCLFVCAVHGDL